MSQRLTYTDLDFAPLSKLPPYRFHYVFDYIKKMYPQDNKNPVSSAGWIFEHGYLRYPDEAYKPPHQIYTAWLRNAANPTIVALAGLVPDDKGVAKAEKLAEQDEYYFGFFGGHRVHPQYRGRGIGTLMIQHRLHELQTYVNQTRRPAAVYAFLDNPLSGRNLAKAGFENLGKRYIALEDSEQFLFRRQVNAAA